MSQQGTNTLATIIKTGVALMIMAMTNFYLPEVIGAPNQTTLAAVDIVVSQPQPNTNTENHKNAGYKKTRHVNTHYKKFSVPRKNTSKHSLGRIKISGYRGQTFVYGEVIMRKDGKVEGFIYHPDDSKTYVYGEKAKDMMNLYDSNGNLYQMLH